MANSSKSEVSIDFLAEIRSFATLNGIEISDQIKSSDDAKTLKLYLSYILQEFESKARTESSARNIFNYQNVNYIKFTYQNLDDVHQISSMLSNLYPDPEKVMLGITEMMLNSVEHGNLGITYQEKGELVSAGKWIHEIETRLQLAANQKKFAEMEFIRKPDKISLIIKDCGNGFDWTRYLSVDSERATHTHGRGIAMARLISFDDIIYKGKGNEVECVVRLSPDSKL